MFDANFVGDLDMTNGHGYIGFTTELPSIMSGVSLAAARLDTSKVSCTLLPSEVLIQHLVNFWHLCSSSIVTTKVACTAAMHAFASETTEGMAAGRLDHITCQIWLLAMASQTSNEAGNLVRPREHKQTRPSYGINILDAMG